MRPIRTILQNLIIFLFSVVLVAGPEVIFAGIIPETACPEGWPIDGKPAIFDRDNLFERINGESELFLPYGFTELIAARFVNSNNPKKSIDLEIYKMGSLLDAFGIYANYRRKDDPAAKIGAEGTISPSQLFFYQGRYLVKLQSTGSDSPGETALMACAGAVSQKLPEKSGRPGELLAFQIQGVEQTSERYISSSLLGYDFFRRGLMADATRDGEQQELFLVPEDSSRSAVLAFEKYRDYLKSAGKDFRVTEQQGSMALKGTDPLYGKIFVEQSGRFIAGAVRFKDDRIAATLVGELLQNASGRVTGGIQPAKEVAP